MSKKKERIAVFKVVVPYSTLKKTTETEELNIVETLVIKPNYHSNVEGVELNDDMIETELIDFYEL